MQERIQTTYSDATEGMERKIKTEKALIVRRNERTINFSLFQKSHQQNYQAY